MKKSIITDLLDSDDDDEEALDDDPIVEHRSISHPGGINRIRV